jgi:hypothetical protein
VSAVTVAVVAVASLIVAVVAIIIALASVVYTRRQAVALEAAAVASKSTAAVEGERRHEELTPELEIIAMARPDADSQWVDMTVELTGPPGLGGLDEVMVRIRDDVPDRKPRDGSQLTQEQIAEVIWGPYRLNPGMENTDSAGRAHGPFPLPVHEPYSLQLEKTMAPSWSDPGDWQRQYEGELPQVEVICTREGHEPWVVRREVRIKYPPSAYLG